MCIQNQTQIFRASRRTAWKYSTVHTFVLTNCNIPALESIANVIWWADFLMVQWSKVLLILDLILNELKNIFNGVLNENSTVHKELGLIIHVAILQLFLLFSHTIFIIWTYLFWTVLLSLCWSFSWFTPLSSTPFRQECVLRRRSTTATAIGHLRPSEIWGAGLSKKWSHEVHPSHLWNTPSILMCLKCHACKSFIDIWVGKFQTAIDDWWCFGCLRF